MDCEEEGKITIIEIGVREKIRKDKERKKVRIRTRIRMRMIKE